MTERWEDTFAGWCIEAAFAVAFWWISLWLMVELMDPLLNREMLETRKVHLNRAWRWLT